MGLVLLLALLPMVASVPLDARKELGDPCCNDCAVVGEEKYFLIDHPGNMCGECCMDPKYYFESKISESVLKKALDNFPCSNHKYTNYTNTVTRGVGRIKVTLDLYAPSRDEDVPMIADEIVPSTEISVGPCCETCTVSGEEKYYSIDHRHNMCGECCMNPKYYPEYKIFEPGLKKAADNTPCPDFKFSTYNSTVTHGFGPIKMTLDLYNPDT
eukprot:CAMPEP_0114546368 /NCGR_PEP_ID=MMETSP0114-20121206/3896_1 /TAXON_ID=31324 /ORGANISM="Goniomonas sp, Strain m" /LENGTH=212 /DNA_ID=CAMNT_0001730857 /DNA_START=6 /DNA_END=644 /DNA_ORIENTATION=-